MCNIFMSHSKAEGMGTWTLLSTSSGSLLNDIKHPFASSYQQHVFLKCERDPRLVNYVICTQT